MEPRKRRLFHPIEEASEAEAYIQAWLAAVHLTAAALALSWGITHMLAVRYHVLRASPRKLQAPSQETSERADAWLRMQSR